MVKKNQKGFSKSKDHKDKSNNFVDEDSDNDDGLFLNSICNVNEENSVCNETEKSSPKKPIFITINIQDIPIKMELDTGSFVSAINPETYS